MFVYKKTLFVFHCCGFYECGKWEESKCDSCRCWLLHTTNIAYSFVKLLLQCNKNFVCFVLVWSIEFRTQWRGISLESQRGLSLELYLMNAWKVTKAKMTRCGWRSSLYLFDFEAKIMTWSIGKVHHFQSNRQFTFPLSTTTSQLDNHYTVPVLSVSAVVSRVNCLWCRLQFWAGGKNRGRSLMVATRLKNLLCWP